MQSYEKTAAYLPISEGLRSFDGTSSTLASALHNFEQDCVGIDVRLMLQRKHFTHKEIVHIKKLARGLKTINTVDQKSMKKLDMKLTALKKLTAELSLGNGAMVQGQVKNIEDATYGDLLHADFDRAERLANTPETMRLLALSPFVIKREELLLYLKDLCLEAGINPPPTRQKRRYSPNFAMGGIL